MNQLINTLPTQIAKPYDRLSTPTHSFTSLGAGASIARDENRIDPTTSLAMAKISIPSSNTDYQILKYDNLTPNTYSPDDVWMLSVYIPQQTNNLRIQILLSDTDNISGIHYRMYQWEGSNLRQGHHNLSCLHVEEYVDATTYGIVGTSIDREWVDSDGVTDTSPVKSINIRVKHLNADLGDSEVFIGAIHSAPSGWAKSCIMWMADDVPQSFVDLAIPLLSCPTTLAITSQYSADPRNKYVPMDVVRQLHNQGHEIWGHLRQHEDITAVTDEQKVRALQSPRDFWRASGMRSASKFMAWPFGRYDDTAISLAKILGYKICRAGGYAGISPLMPAVNPYYIPGFNMEKFNSWQVDTAINGFIKRGESVIMYAHNVEPGGQNENTRPATSVAVYADHINRWANLVRSYEVSGLAIGTTVSEFYNLCGVNAESDFMVE